MDAKNIGRNLKEIMDCMDLTQTELAQKTGLTQSAISQIVNSDRSPSLESVIRLLQVIPTTFERLCRGPTPESGSEEKT